MSSDTPPVSDTPPGSDTPPPAVIAEVRYSLPRLLAELQIERTNSTFAMERLDQQEIGKLFKAKPIRRVKPKK